MTKLDFVIIGAEKAGTSYLVEALQRSPDVALPAPEVRYFRDPFYPTRERPEDVFAGTTARLKGIKHPSYLGRPEVAERIYQHNPETKLIAVLRNPVDRAISTYLHYIRYAQIPLVHPNEGLPLLFAGDERVPKYADILEFGLYGRHLDRYLRFFPDDQLLLLEFEDLVTKTDWLEPLGAFLGIDRIDAPAAPVNEGSYDWNRCTAEFAIALVTNVYDAGRNIVGRRDDVYARSFTFEQLKALPPEPVGIDQEVRARLAAYYQPDMRALSERGLFRPRHW